MTLTHTSTSLNTVKKKDISLSIIRHAEVGTAPSGQGDNDRGISKQGRKEAEALGRELASHPGGLRLVKSSPVGRCVDTARALLSGAGRSLKIVQSRVLGSPGCFVVDGDLAYRNFRRYGVDGVVQRLLEGSKLIGMRSVADGVALLLDEVVTDLKRLSGLGLYISHDAILVPFVLHTTGRMTTRGNWISFLDGVSLWQEGNGLFMAWRQEVFDITDFVESGRFD